MTGALATYYVDENNNASLIDHISWINTWNSFYVYVVKIMRLS